ncbi:RHS repeat-associated core domain-containing protein [Chryseobacterium sp. MHB01]|uniref:RHS repeat-associated core domain-containing protein n=1 Tax=Chryseobacterium sp. MHB01 TaxID=3109433 RepID=UPI002AFF0E00|nr:RHS repeat-associated core domain-containing protein [Chryseobacterium sp. MHB01]MEA1849454.1 RHS repeat-associated core domain-containing protein [Chryseobacterium sp. MHB01]
MKRIVLTGFVLIAGFTHAQEKSKTQTKPKAEKPYINPVKLTKEERNRPYMDEVLKSRDPLTPEEAERRRKNIEAGNPFKKYGYYPKVATLSKGKYLEFHDKDSIVSIGSVRFNKKTKEIVEFREIDLSDPDAQPYLDTAGRWFSPDPLSEEYSSWSPYNMVMNNPIKNIDPDGRGVLDNFQLLQNGQVKLIEKTDDKTDTLFASDKKGNVDKSNSVTVQKGIVGQLQYYRDGNTSDSYPAYHQAIKESTESTQNDMSKLFDFSAKNSTVEFSLTDFKINDKKFISLQTYNSDERSPGMNQIGVKDGSEIKLKHNHPSKDTYDSTFTEINSMGYKSQNGRTKISGDYYNVRGNGTGKPINYKYQTYFPKSGNLYNITPTGIKLVR